jgi:hypothetical protein
MEHVQHEEHPSTFNPNSRTNRPTVIANTPSDMFLPRAHYRDEETEVGKALDTA